MSTGRVEGGDRSPGPAPTTAAAPGGLPVVLRLVSGMLFVPLLMLLAWVGRFSFFTFVAVMVMLALHEFYGMMRSKGVATYRVLGSLATLGLLWITFRPQPSHADFLATAALLLGLAFALRRSGMPRQVEAVSVTLFGVLYVGWLASHLILLRELPWRAGLDYGQGASFVYLAFLTTWSCDTGAFAIGKAFGRTRPWTEISPRKSLEGAVGGFCCAVAGALLARAWFAPYLGLVDAIVLGVLVGVFAQVGDLVESLFKRDARHGDSSDLIPGHGGVLDRFDSLLFTGPLVYYYLKLAVFGVP